MISFASCKKENTQQTIFIDALIGNYMVSGTLNTLNGPNYTSTPIVPDTMIVSKIDDSSLYIIFRTWQANFKYHTSLADYLLYQFSTVGLISGTGHDYANFYKGTDSVTATLNWGGGVNRGGYSIQGTKLH